MVTIITLHLLLIGIFFLTVSQVAPFQEMVLLSMMIIGIILVSLGIVFRVLKVVLLKIKKEAEKFLGRKPKQKFPVSKNNYLTYFLIFLAFIFTLWGLMTMPSTP